MSGFDYFWTAPTKKERLKRWNIAKKLLIGIVIAAIILSIIFRITYK